MVGEPHFQSLIFFERKSLKFSKSPVDAPWRSPGETLSVRVLLIIIFFEKCLLSISLDILIGTVCVRLASRSSVRIFKLSKHFQALLFDFQAHENAIGLIRLP